MNSRRAGRNLLRHWLLGAAAMVSLVSMMAQDAPPSEERAPVRPRVEAQRQSQEKISQLQEKLQDLVAAGRMDDAAKVKAEIAELNRPRLERGRISAPDRIQNEDRLDRRAPARRPRPKVESPRVVQGEDPGEVELRPEQRLRHLRIAIEHLHAAGLHPAAERLERIADRMRPQPGNAGGAGPRPGAEVERTLKDLQNQVQELRQGMRLMKERLEDVARERRLSE
jgi:hypothetical protein